MPYSGQPGREQWRTPAARPQRPARLTPWLSLMLCASRMWSPLPRQPIKKGGGGSQPDRAGQGPRRLKRTQRFQERRPHHRAAGCRAEGGAPLASCLQPCPACSGGCLEISLFLTACLHCDAVSLRAPTPRMPSTSPSLGDSELQSGSSRHPPLKGRGPPSQKAPKGNGAAHRDPGDGPPLVGEQDAAIGRTTTPGRRVTQQPCP